MRTDDLFNGDLIQMLESDDSFRMLALVRLDANVLIRHVDNLKLIFINLSSNSISDDEIFSFIEDALRFILGNADEFSTLIGIFGGYIEDFYYRSYSEIVELTKRDYEALTAEFNEILSTVLALIENTFNTEFVDFYNNKELFFPEFFLCFKKYYTIGFGDKANHFLELILYNNKNYIATESTVSKFMYIKSKIC